MERFAMVDVGSGFFGFVARGGKLVATFLPQSRKAILGRIKVAFPDAVEDADLFPQFRRDIVSYYRGEKVRFTTPVDLRDQPAYRRTVLQACRRVHYGKTATYVDLARATDNPNAARAVGSAMANNPLPLVIPCHRVLRSDGGLGGFSSPHGVRQKLDMLALEGVDTESLRRQKPVSGRQRSVKVA